MDDRKKVLKGLESCAKSDPENWCYHMCEQCPYELTKGCKHILAADALEVLKEQEERLKQEYMRGYDKAWDEIGRR
jgi:hypothetical protein